MDKINTVLYFTGAVGAIGTMIICTIEDIRKKQIHLWHTGIFVVQNVILACCEKRECSFILAGLMVGVVFLGISLCTGEKIGRGDAFFIMGMGAFLGFYNTVWVVFIALLTVSVYGTGLVLAGRRYKWSCEIAFMPFLLVPYMGSTLFQVYGNWHT